MLISKNGREYTITECKNVWKAERIIGGVSVVYEIPKKGRGRRGGGRTLY